MSRFSRSSNPAMRADIFQNAGGASNAMTFNGTLNKIGFLTLLLFVAASFTWKMTYANPSSSMGFMMVGGIGGFILAMITIFSKQNARFTAPLYAVCEGIFLGGISAMYNIASQGIVFQAILLTFGTLVAMFIAYRTGIIKPTEKFKAGVVAATMGIFFAYMFSIILSFLGVSSPIGAPSSMGLLISVVIVIVAALNLVLDFDVITQGVNARAPEHFEWYAAFGLMVTLVWLYLEILRLLAILNRRD